MAEMKLDLTQELRAGMIDAGANFVDALPNYRFGIILELLMRDPISRCMIAEAMGEAAVREHTSFHAGNPKWGSSWDEIMLEVLAELKDSPGGRGEV